MATVKKKVTKKTASKDAKVKDILDVREDIFTEDGEKVVLVTKEGLDKLKEEYNFLTTAKKKEVAARLKEAISYGDLSENSEYEEAKNEQAFVEGRILELERMIKNSKVISGKATGRNSVQLGTTVYLKNLTKSLDETYTIVGSTEANPFEGKISNESPLGNALLDREKGDKCKVIVPAGVVEYEIIKLG
ncbi:transcription elongation factor GreA [Candidatus Peregrinibacteria bacterium HGW-Peregrinibacteria-1]|jgi:transcription elongation factor GreA|nr:MAG: transcription elongation factor GreA [Candidatus Peregrinibacteria bacterium HGW-Peregrinibacteria-1]